MKKVLITDYVHPKLITRLQEAGYEVDYNQNITMDELEIIIHTYHGIVINSKTKMYPPMIDLAINLEFICRLGSGLEIIDLPYAAERNIKVINTPEGNCNAVAEHAMGMILAYANNLIRSNQEVKNFEWNREKNRGFELKGKTIGIIGFGHTGRSLAKKLKSWEVNIIAHDKYVKDFPEEHKDVKSVSKEYIQAHADIISFHLPLTDETDRYVDDKFIERCKRGVIFINTSRGSVVVTESLIKGLEEERISGACLDVFQNEKPKTYNTEERLMYEKLFNYENVIVSPHVAGWTSESLEHISDVILEKLGI